MEMGRARLLREIRHRWADNGHGSHSTRRDEEKIRVVKLLFEIGGFDEGKACGQERDGRRTKWGMQNFG